MRPSHSQSTGLGLRSAAQSVIGGGGGLHHPWRKTPLALPGLSREDADYEPLFHYLTVQRCGDGLVMRSLRMNTAMDGVEEGRRFEYALEVR